LASKAKECLEHTLTLGEAQRQRLTLALTTVMNNHEDIRKQSTRLTHGKKLPHCKLVNAYDPAIAPIIKGKSNCPVQFGRKPGLASDRHRLGLSRSLARGRRFSYTTVHPDMAENHREPEHALPSAA
jgi:hypothetical protein